MSRPSRPFGLLNLNKPGGMTSRDVVNRVTKHLRKVKVGHAGTLDPLASGVLVVCVGPATRLIEYVQDAQKTYRTVIRLGATSNTLDADGQIIENPDAPIPTRSQIEQVLPTQVGTILQLPPQFSALKVEGKRAYDLAREGQVIELAPRPVRVDRIGLLSYEWPRLELEIDCGGGTYIRSIARDIGEALGCGGLVEVLIRTRIGQFRIEDAVDPLQLTDTSTVLGHLLPPLTALTHLPHLNLDANQQAAILRGMAIPATGLPAGDVALISTDGDLIAIAEMDPTTDRLSPRRVLAGA
jgi:tRNA pseudouridine55 synthase